MSRRTGQTRPDRVALLLDELHAPAAAEALRKRGHDGVAVAEGQDLRALADADLLVWAAQS